MHVYEGEFEIRLIHLFSLTVHDVVSLLLFPKPDIHILCPGMLKWISTDAAPCYECPHYVRSFFPTGQKLRERMNGHRADIRNKAATPVEIHFNMLGHN